MSIKTWPKNERPREKLLNHGASGLSNAELLAIFIQTGSKQKSALAIAQDLLAQFGSMRALLDAPLKDLSQVPGIGPAKYVLLQAALELSQRYLHQTIVQQPLLNTANKTKHYLRLSFRQRDQEVFACLFLSNHNHLIACETLFEGTINHSQVYPREIVARALHHKATSIILAHNHPSGKCDPSQSDIELTQQLKKHLGFLHIAVLDHFIVTEHEVYSFAENGIIF